MSRPSTGGALLPAANTGCHPNDAVNEVCDGGEHAMPEGACELTPEQAVGSALATWRRLCFPKNLAGRYTTNGHVVGDAEPAVRSAEVCPLKWVMAI